MYTHLDNIYLFIIKLSSSIVLFYITYNFLHSLLEVIDCFYFI